MNGDGTFGGSALRRLGLVSVALTALICYLATLVASDAAPGALGLSADQEVLGVVPLIFALLLGHHLQSAYARTPRQAMFIWLIAAPLSLFIASLLSQAAQFCLTAGAGLLRFRNRTLPAIPRRHEVERMPAPDRSSPGGYVFQHPRLVDVSSREPLDEPHGVLLANMRDRHDIRRPAPPCN